MIMLSFIVSLLVFVAIGLSSSYFSKGDKKDYYLANQSVHPALCGLSAVATNNSGYMFIGAIGYTYAVGFSAIWLMIGWILGDFIASLFIFSRLRKVAEQSGELSYAGVLAAWAGDKRLILQRVISLVSLLFLVAYASAQFIAGSKALHVLLDWPLWSGAILSACLVIAYCVSGGIRASIWTDVAQSCVMIVAMFILLFFGLAHLGGIGNAVNEMSQHENFLSWSPKDIPFEGVSGAMLFLAGWMFAGFSVAGQPHIMVRFLTLNKTENINQAKLWYYLWFILFFIATIGVGMLSKVILSEQANFDAELALPTMAMELLSPVLVGIVLAGIFAATMSTADSLVLSCSAAITHDLLPHKIERPLLLKSVTAVVTLVCLLWAIFNSQSVFNMVIMAWSGLASAFVPLIVVLCISKQAPKLHVSLSGIAGGLLVALVWRWQGLSDMLYEGMPGVIAGLAVFYAYHLFYKFKPSMENSAEGRVSLNN